MTGVYARSQAIAFLGRRVAPTTICPRPADYLTRPPPQRCPAKTPPTSIKKKAPKTTRVIARGIAARANLTTISPKPILTATNCTRPTAVFVFTKAPTAGRR